MGSSTLVSLGRSMYALGLAGLGLWCFVYGDFLIGRPPAWPPAMTFNPMLAYVTGAMAIAAALALLANWQLRPVALFLATLILLLSATRHGVHFMVDWVNTYKTLALAGGALIVAATGWRRGSYAYGSPASTADGTLLFRLGCVLLALFFIASGYAHFVFAGFVEQMIPAYIPFRLFFAYFCGVCLIAGGIGLFVRPVRYWAALLSAVMVTSWFFLLHIPRVAANVNDRSDRLGLFESFAVAGAFFVVAGVFAAADRRSR